MTEYFRHDYNARNEIKLKRVFMKHGMAGIGLYWCIIEMLYENDGYIKKDQIPVLAFDWRVDEELINDIIENYGLFESDESAFFSNGVLKRLEERQSKSDKARASASVRWNSNRNATMVQEQSERNANAMRTQCNSNARIEENRIEENRIDYIYICQQVVDAYHSCCPSLPKVRELTDKRKKQIENRSKKYGLEDFKNVFTKAEQSDFLSGRSGTWKSCNFDWLINDSNMIKVLEGTYDNKASTNGFNNYEQRAYTNDLEMRLLQKNALI